MVKRLDMWRGWGRRTRAAWWLVAAVVVLALATPRAARADGCPDAVAKRLGGTFVAAEAAARACLAAAPDDVGVWFELSRAIGYQGRHTEALDWVERGLERYPDDADLGLWRVRLLGWLGRLDEARAAFGAILAKVPALGADRETAMLGVDLRFWGHDWEGAAAGFSQYLSSWPDDADALRKRGVSNIERGLEREALSDFDAACRVAGPGAPVCAMRDELRRKDARVTLSLGPSYATDGRVDEVQTRVGLLARVWDELRLGVAGELRHRAATDAAGEASDDTLAGFLAGYRGRHWSAEGGVDLGFAPTFAPELSAWIEPAVEIANPVWLHLRFWHIAFAESAANVISPSLDVYVGPVELDLRYWLGLGDGTTSHTGLVRARWALSPSFTAELGLGAGTAGDYLTLSSTPSDGHEVGLVGVAWSPSWRHKLRAGYVLRRESSAGPGGGETLLRHEAQLGYELRL